MGHFYQNLLRQEGSLECITAARYQYGNSDQDQEEQEHCGSARASNEPLRRFHNHREEKARTRAFSGLKEPTSGFTFKTLC